MKQIEIKSIPSLWNRNQTENRNQIEIIALTIMNQKTYMYIITINEKILSKFILKMNMTETIYLASNNDLNVSKGIDFYLD